YGASCSELVFGSILETLPFVSLAPTASLLVAARSDRVVPNALVSTAVLGTNAALAPHALFAVPLLWLGLMRFWPWLRTALLFLFALAAIALALAWLQERVYPGLGFFFQKNAASAYQPWWSIPETKKAILHRASFLIRHFFAFSVVAPQALFSNKWTTFMQDQNDVVAHYDTSARASYPSGDCWRSRRP